MSFESFSSALFHLKRQSFHNFIHLFQSFNNDVISIDRVPVDSVLDRRFGSSGTSTWSCHSSTHPSAIELSIQRIIWSVGCPYDNRVQASRTSSTEYVMPVSIKASIFSGRLTCASSSDRRNICCSGPQMEKPARFAFMVIMRNSITSFLGGSVE